MEHVNSVILLIAWMVMLILLPFITFKRKRNVQAKEPLYVDRIPTHSGPDPFESDLEEIEIISIENSDSDLYLPKKGCS